VCPWLAIALLACGSGSSTYGTSDGAITSASDTSASAGTDSSTCNTSSHGGLAVVGGTVGTRGTQTQAVGALLVVEQRFEYTAPTCGGNYCVNGGIVP
jgi:hypothetical protein